jgi:hypothetical protein
VPASINEPFNVATPLSNIKGVTVRSLNEGATFLTVTLVEVVVTILSKSTVAELARKRRVTLVMPGVVKVVKLEAGVPPIDNSMNCPDAGSAGLYAVPTKIRTSLGKYPSILVVDRSR